MAINKKINNFLAVTSTDYHFSNVNRLRKNGWWPQNKNTTWLKEFFIVTLIWVTPNLQSTNHFGHVLIRFNWTIHSIQAMLTEASLKTHTLTTVYLVKESKFTERAEFRSLRHRDVLQRRTFRSLQQQEEKRVTGGWIFARFSAEWALTFQNRAHVRWSHSVKQRRKFLT